MSRVESESIPPPLGLYRIYLLFAASGLMIFAASPPFAFGAVAFFSLVPLLHAVRMSPSYRVAGLGGFLAGATLFLPGVYWISHVSYAAWLSLAPYCAIYLAVFALFAYTSRKSGPFRNAALLAACWMLLEVVRGHMFTGFPWLLLSHTQYNFTVFTQVLDVIGAYGLSGIIVMLNALLYAAISRQRGPGLLAAAVFTAICVYGYFRIQSVRIEPALRVASVQASVPQEMKETLEGKYDPTGILMRYVSVTESIPRSEEIDMIVWPETVLLFPYTLNVNPEVLNKENAEPARLAQGLLGMLARNHGASLLTGATSYLPVKYGYVNDPALARQIPPGAWNSRYNSAYLLGPDGSYRGRYDKIHLVPFGEYIPLPNIFPFLSKLVPFTESLIAGEQQTLFHVKGGGGREADFGVLICYEDLDAELARGLRQLGADFLVNISNDAWFGTSIELDQHFAVARFRAIENRVGVVRSGNNGITGLIDPVGRVTSLFAKESNGVQATKDIMGYLVGEVSTSNSFSLYSRVGDVPLIVLSGVLLLYWTAASRRRRSGREPVATVR